MDSSYSNDGFWVKGIVFPPWRRVFEPTRGKCLWPSIIIIEQYSAHCTPYLAWPHMSTVKHSKLNVDLYKNYHSKHFFILLGITWSGRVRDHQNLIFTKIWSPPKFDLHQNLIFCIDYLSQKLAQSFWNHFRQTIFWFKESNFCW